MKIEKILTEQHAAIVQRWIDAVLETYPAQSVAVLRANRDPFTNPGQAMLAEAAEVLVAAVQGVDLEINAVRTSLDRFVKFRAVQALTPSQSMGIIYLLKPILRKQILPMVNGADLQEYLEVESRIDSLALLAFDMFMQDRETLYDIRVKEIKNQYAQLKRWAQALNAEAPLGEFIGCGNN